MQLVDGRNRREVCRMLKNDPTQVREYRKLSGSLRDWVQQRLGGYVQMSIPERREAVKELNGNGHSTRKIAEVVGVDQSQIVRDLKADANASRPPSAPAQNTDLKAAADANASDAPPREKSKAAKEREERCCPNLPMP